MFCRGPLYKAHKNINYNININIKIYIFMRKVHFWSDPALFFSVCWVSPVASALAGSTCCLSSSSPTTSPCVLTIPSSSPSLTASAAAAAPAAALVEAWKYWKQINFHTDGRLFTFLMRFLSVYTVLIIPPVVRTVGLPPLQVEPFSAVENIFLYSSVWRSEHPTLEFITNEQNRSMYSAV